MSFCEQPKPGSRIWSARLFTAENTPPVSNATSANVRIVRDSSLVGPLQLLQSGNVDETEGTITLPL